MCIFSLFAVALAWVTSVQAFQTPNKLLVKVSRRADLRSWPCVWSFGRLVLSYNLIILPVQAALLRASLAVSGAVGPWHREFTLYSIREAPTPKASPKTEECGCYSLGLAMIFTRATASNKYIPSLQLGRFRTTVSRKRGLCVFLATNTYTVDLCDHTAAWHTHLPDPDIDCNSKFWNPNFEL